MTNATKQTWETLSGSRTLTSFNEDGMVVSRSTSTIDVGGKLFNRDIVRSGDFHTPLPYYVGEVTMTPGIHTKDSWTKYWDSSKQIFQTYRSSTLVESYHNYLGSGLGPSSWYIPYKTISIPCLQEANAVNEALSELNSRRLDAAMIIAELTQTSEHLAKTVVSLCRALLDLRHGRLTKSLKHLGLTKEKIKNHTAWTDRWLEYRYAVYPLMLDYAEAVALVQHGLDGLGYAHITGKGQVVNDLGKSGSANGWDYRINGESNHNTKVTAYVDAAEMVGLKALTSVDPRTIAWELTPWSFVVDQLIPIGTYLDTFQATLGLLPRGWYNSQYTSYTIDFTKSSTVPEPAGAGPWWYEDWSCSTSVRLYKRTVDGGFPTTQLPTFQNPLSVRNVVTAVALLNSLLKGK